MCVGQVIIDMDLRTFIRSGHAYLHMQHARINDRHMHMQTCSVVCVTTTRRCEKKYPKTMNESFMFGVCGPRRRAAAQGGWDL